MPLSTKSPPRRSTKVFLKWISRFKANGVPQRTPKARGAKREPTPNAERVFVLTTHDLARGRGPKGAKFLAWRHFGIGRNTRHRVSADIVASGKSHSLARMYDQQPTVNLARALQLVKRKYSRSRQYSDIRLLRIPPMVDLAIWVRGRSAKDDLIMPIESCHSGVRKGASHRFADVLPLLQASAKVLADQSASLQAQLKKKGSWA